ncbi:MAG: hypothetical protein ACTSRC_18660 [Candidatus Helarchaeota archaeon]
MVSRKITFKNDSSEKIEHFEFKLVETKDVRFSSANPNAVQSDPPEYTWKFSIDPEVSYAIELKFQTHVRKTFEIEKERPRNADRAPTA